MDLTFLSLHGPPLHYHTQRLLRWTWVHPRPIFPTHPRAPPHIRSSKENGKNDFIAKEDFAVHYSTIDNVVGPLSRFEKEAMMAKVDL
jgi:hypothetical protein